MIAEYPSSDVEENIFCGGYDTCMSGIKTSVFLVILVSTATVMLMMLAKIQSNNTSVDVEVGSTNSTTQPPMSMSSRQVILDTLQQEYIESWKDRRSIIGKLAHINHKVSLVLLFGTALTLFSFWILIYKEGSGDDGNCIYFGEIGYCTGFCFFFSPCVCYYLVLIVTFHG
jgi:hypothetical protein